MRAVAHVLLVLFFPLLVLASFFRARADDRADQIRAAIALFDLQQAQVTAAAMCRRLRCGRAIEVRVEEDRKFGSGVMAKVTRDDDGSGCLVHVKREYVGREDVIAHEVCHCKNDWEVFGRWGYEPGVTVSQAAWREGRAETCAKGLVGR